MARFNFRLQQYLDIKEQIEEQKELEYGAACRKVAEERQRLADLTAQRLQVIEDMRNQLLQAIDTRKIRIHNNTIERLKHMIIAQIERLRQAEIFQEQKRQELVAAMQNRKAIEKVKDSALDEHLRTVDAVERKTVDELVSYRYTLKHA